MKLKLTPAALPGDARTTVRPRGASAAACCRADDSGWQVPTLTQRMAGCCPCPSSLSLHPHAPPSMPQLTLVLGTLTRRCQSKQQSSSPQTSIKLHIHPLCAQCQGYSVEEPVTILCMA